MMTSGTDILLLIVSCTFVGAAVYVMSRILGIRSRWPGVFVAVVMIIFLWALGWVEL